MKYLLAIFLLLAVAVNIVGCTADNGKTLEGVKAQGGVDVGNAPAVVIPQTSASLKFPPGWQTSVRSDVVYIDNQSGSSIEAKKSEITDLSSPTALSLQLYLKAKFPDRSYKQVRINGLEGVRAELTETASEKSSDLYLVSEQGDFVHIRSYLKDVGIPEGDDIILSVRVQYRGEAVPVVTPKTITLESHTGSDKSKKYYSFQDDCFRYADPACDLNGGAAIALDRTFKVGVAGYEHGGVVELGPEVQIPFDSIRVEGKYLVAPVSNILISDIYTAFTPAEQQPELREIQLRKGYTYLVRTINWPNEDLITKMSVQDVSADQAIIKYQKLISVNHESLQAQVDAANKNTLDNEMQTSDGEVTLYDRFYWRNFFYSSFNFEYSTSGNMFITKNNWDLSLDSGCTNEPMLSVPSLGSQVGEVADLGARDLATITESDFKTPTTSQQGCGLRAIVNHVYTVYRHNDVSGITTLGSVQVLEIGPQNKWTRFRFRRIKVSK